MFCKKFDKTYEIKMFKSRISLKQLYNIKQNFLTKNRVPTSSV
jgi:hypothetical protein